MNNTYLERAKKVITNPQILSIVAGKRARQLAWGARPMLKCDSENHLDVALLEIAEGKLYYTQGETPQVDIFANIADYSPRTVAQPALKPEKFRKEEIDDENDDDDDDFGNDDDFDDDKGFDGDDFADKDFDDDDDN